MSTDYGNNATQAGDVLMFDVGDGGDISLVGGYNPSTGATSSLVEMTELFETMVYLELVGGNDGDDGSEAASTLQWWGNEGEPQNRQYRSKFQSIIKGSPLTSKTLSELQGVAQSQLETLLIDGGYAVAVSVSVSMPRNKTVSISVAITIFGGEIVPVEMTLPVGEA
jgi:hypothetical protein